MKITVYTINDCKFSQAEKEYLKKNNMEFEEKNLETNRDFLTEMLSISNNFAGTPVTKIEKDSGESVVLKGFTQEEFDKALGITTTAPAAQPAVVAATATTEVPQQAADATVAEPEVNVVSQAEVPEQSPVTPQPENNMPQALGTETAADTAEPAPSQPEVTTSDTNPAQEQTPAEPIIVESLSQDDSNITPSQTESNVPPTPIAPEPVTPVATSTDNIGPISLTDTAPSTNPNEAASQPTESPAVPQANPTVPSVEGNGQQPAAPAQNPDALNSVLQNLQNQVNGAVPNEGTNQKQ